MSAIQFYRQKSTFIQTISFFIMNILEQYVKQAPSEQLAIDLFQGSWASKMPSERADLQAGGAALFEDPRIQWAADVLGGFADNKVLELGPLEAGHSYMLQKMGVSHITAIEANSHAYVKCLIMKEIFNLHKVNFHLGDFMPYLRECNEKFDFCLASGVLYHMQQPMELLYLISQISDKTMLFTHYYDHEIIQARSDMAHKYAKPKTHNTHGFKHQIYKHNYAEALDRTDYCGGNESYSIWLSRDDIINGLKFFGFKRIETAFEGKDHIHGPCFCITAEK
jgi:hypothetical protein